MMSELTRRSILVGAGAFAATGLTHSQKTYATENIRYREPGKDNYDVIIIGGGFAGVTAARELGNSGYKTLILEAANRLGGQTFTSEIAGNKIELGGSWIHWLQPHIWAEIERYGLEIDKTAAAEAPEQITVFDPQGGTRVIDPEKAIKLINQGFSELCSVARDVFPRPYDPLFQDEYKQYDHLTIMDRLKQLDMPQDQHDILSGLFVTNCHHGQEKGSFLELLRCYALAGFDAAQFMEITGTYKIKEGTIALINAMVAESKAKIKLATPVSQVIQDGQAVHVVTEEGVFHAAALISTLPLDVMGNINFQLGHQNLKKQTSYEKHTGNRTKFYIKIKNKIHPFIGFSPSPNPINRLVMDHSDSDGSVLIGFGYSSDAFNIHDTGMVQDAIRKFIPDAIVEKTFGHDWNNDPYTKRSCNNYSSGQFSNNFTDLREVENNIFLAGSDFAKGWRGFIDGAIESGLSAGRLVKSHLGNNSTEI